MTLNSWNFLDGKVAGKYGPVMPLFEVLGLSGPRAMNNWMPTHKTRHSGWCLLSYHPPKHLTWLWAIYLSPPPILSHANPRLVRKWCINWWIKPQGHISLVMHGWSLSFYWQSYHKTHNAIYKTN